MAKRNDDQAGARVPVTSGSARTRWSAALVAGLAAACIPFPNEPHWRPSGTGFEPLRAHCQGQAGPVTRARYRIDGDIVATAFVAKDGGRADPNTYIGVNLEVAGLPVQFAERGQLRVGDQWRDVPVRITRTQQREGRYENVHGDYLVRPPMGRAAYARLDTPLPDDVGRSVELRLPRATRGDREIAMPALRFDYVVISGGLQPFNC